ncbi:unnamed protein product [Soboliphyme baturini]|uniref:Secreted protein n=1 Tax=Soboliphyme baturini TaxID=241478 RepID=A0A183IYI1_9BILA|nr:unnamed protein product [Soboliphyme baturini]
MHGNTVMDRLYVRIRVGLWPVTCHFGVCALGPQRHAAFRPIGQNRQGPGQDLMTIFEVIFRRKMSVAVLSFCIFHNLMLPRTIIIVSNCITQSQGAL